MVNLLVVDDSSTNTLLIESSLKKNNKYQVTVASSGEEALKIINKKAIDIVVLDIMMPGMSGYDVFEEMKKDKNSAKIPVIILTAGNHDGGDKAKELGAAGYFEKPVDIETLIATMDTLV